MAASDPELPVAAPRGAAGGGGRGSSEAIWVLSLIGFYLAVTWGNLNTGYIDFGDGNYLYISRRISEGLVMYRDIVSPQPPLHLMVGTALVAASRPLEALLQPLGGGWAEHADVLLIRVYLSLIHAAFMFLLWRVSRHLFDEPVVRVLSLAVYLVLPNTYLWSRGFQSENHELLFLYGAFLFLLWESRRGIVLSAIASVLGICTNMTFAPYLVLFVAYLLLARPRGWFLFPAIVALGVGAVFGAFHIASDGHMIDNVILNQVGTFPRENLPLYVWGKLLSEGGDLLRVEGAFIVAAVIGVLARAGTGGERGFVLWFAMFALGSIVFVSKGGTAEYIFVLGEPVVALFSAYLIYAVITGSDFSLNPRLFRLDPGVYAVRWIITVFGLSFALYQPLDHLYRTLARETTYEAPTRVSNRIAYLIEPYLTAERDTIFAPPYYAVLTDSRVLGECSETYIWYIRIRSSDLILLDSGSDAARAYAENPAPWGDRVFENRTAGRPYAAERHPLTGERAVLAMAKGQRYVYADAKAHRQVADMVDELAGGRCAHVLLRSGQLGDIPELREAVNLHFRPPNRAEWSEIQRVFRGIDARYQPTAGYNPQSGEIEWVAILTLNERLEFFVPR